MNFLSNVGSGFTKAIDFVVEKNRKIALINRVKLVIRNEDDNAQRAYIALGKYYFRNLRDEQNAETENCCDAIDNANKRRERALLKLEDLTAPEEPEYHCDEDEMCDEACCDCSCYEEDLAKLDGVEEEDEQQEEVIGKILHPELVWHDDEDVNESDEAAADAYSKTIPTDEP